MLRIRVLGSIPPTLDGRPVELGGARQRRLLGMLAAADGRVVSTERLVDQLWDGAVTDAASRTFRTYIARLRRSIEAAGATDGGQLVVTEAPGYRLGTDVAIDADEFSAAIDEARDRLTVGEAASAWNGLNEALALWSGDAFDEFAGEEWASPSAIRLEELRLVARELRISAQIELGRHAEAIAEIDAFIAEQPLRETPRRDQMIALYRAGRHAEALRAGREYAKFLGEETGLEPSTAITDIETMIIEGDPRLDSTPRAGASAATCSKNRSARTPSGWSTAPVNPRSAATSLSPWSPPHLPTIRTSSEDSRAEPRRLRASNTRESCRSTTTGASQAARIS